MRRGYLIVVGLIVSGCATTGLTKQQCANIDSFKLGQIDGSRGRDTNLIDQHLQTCPQLDRISYMNGHTAGTKEYCSIDIAFYEGQHGSSFYDSSRCDLEKRDKLSSEFTKGRKVFLLKQQKAALDGEIDKKEEALQKDKSVVGDIRKTYYLLTGTSATDDLKKEKSKVNSEIVDLESKAPISVTTLSRDAENESLGVNVSGALLGTFIGFGTGHAVQGRYSSDGWQWTAGDAAALSAVIISTRSFCKSNEVHAGEVGASASTQECSNSLPVLSALGFIGLRVWQGIDLWTHLGRPEYQKLNSSNQPSWTLGIAANGLPTLWGTF